MHHLDGISFSGGKNLQRLALIANLENCSFQIDGAENLKYLDMTSLSFKYVIELNDKSIISGFVLLPNDGKFDK
jgi:hypothetical protein